MAKMSWRETILEAVRDHGCCPIDSLHEGAEGEDDLQEATDAADALVREGVLEERAMCLYPAGSEAASRVQAARPD